MLVRTQLTLFLLGLPAFVPAAHPQTAKFPERPVRVVVPVPPGGGIDAVGRLVAMRMTDAFGQQFVVDNRTGAGGTIGSEIVARANPDGHTVLVYGSSYPANAALYKLTYDPVKGMAAVGMIASGPYVLIVHPSIKAANLKEFIELTRPETSSLNYGSAGNGSIPHLAGELFQQMTRTKMAHVPYKGIGAALNDLLGARIQAFFTSAVAGVPHIKAGRVRGIAVTSEKRSPALPDLPAIREAVPGYSVALWYGMWAPAGTPRATIAQLNQAIARLVKLPEVEERLRAGGAEPAHSTPEEQSRAVAREIATWSKLIQARNIKSN
jgi:tripartite-type tricarboxylate transporter receptor subunit TctC